MDMMLAPAVVYVGQEDCYYHLYKINVSAGKMWKYFA